MLKFLFINDEIQEQYEKEIEKLLNDNIMKNTHKQNEYTNTYVVLEDNLDIAKKLLEDNIEVMELEDFIELTYCGYAELVIKNEVCRCEIIVTLNEVLDMIPLEILNTKDQLLDIYNSSVPVDEIINIINYNGRELAEEKIKHFIINNQVFEC